MLERIILNSKFLALLTVLVTLFCAAVLYPIHIVYSAASRLLCTDREGFRSRFNQGYGGHLPESGRLLFYLYWLANNFRGHLQIIYKSKYIVARGDGIRYRDRSDAGCDVLGRQEPEAR